MILFNFWHLKEKNGMFYFGIDYLENISTDKSGVVVICRFGVFDEGDFPSGFRVLPLNFRSYLLYVLNARVKGWGLFSPTVHCIPFYPKQVSVLHDCYPFEGGSNRLKRVVLILMLLFGGGYIGGINRSSVLPFLRGKGLNKIFYCPNLLPERISTVFKRKEVRQAAQNQFLRVGLVGTDSRKKRYEMILESRSYNFKNFEFVFFGTDTRYYREMYTKLSSRGYKVRRVDSSEVNLDIYLVNCIDVLMSVAMGEGFCRPVAQAAMFNVPVFLLKDPVFTEFYRDTAVIKETFPELVAALEAQSGWVVGKRLDKAARRLQSDISRDFARSTTFIREYLKL